MEKLHSTGAKESVNIDLPLLLSPEVFCASDLQETVCPAVTSSLLAAMIEWGSYEPVEYWVLGSEKEAASKLTNINCERRENRGQQSMDDCLGRHGSDSGGLDFYRRIGEEGIENNFGSASAAHMGHDEWGFHFFGSSIPFGFTDLFLKILNFFKLFPLRKSLLFRTKLYIHKSTISAVFF